MRSENDYLVPGPDPRSIRSDSSLGLRTMFDSYSGFGERLDFGGQFPGEGLSSRSHASGMDASRKTRSRKHRSSESSDGHLGECVCRSETPGGWYSHAHVETGRDVYRQRLVENAYNFQRRGYPPTRNESRLGNLADLGPPRGWTYDRISHYTCGHLSEN